MLEDKCTTLQVNFSLVHLNFPWGSGMADGLYYPKMLCSITSADIIYSRRYLAMVQSRVRESLTKLYTVLVKLVDLFFSLPGLSPRRAIALPSVSEGAALALALTSTKCKSFTLKFF